MNEEILINITSMESRVAVVESGVLQEIHIERTHKSGLVGNIYKGRVIKVMPGMQAAFVDIGLERSAFIHANEVIDRQPDKQQSREKNITQLIHEGQELIVQVIKNPLGTKGARLTTHVSLPARYLVFMPDKKYIGISLRIDVEEERERLRELMQHILDTENITMGGFILRTAAGSGKEEAIRADVQYLQRLWQSIEEQLESCENPFCVYEDLPLFLRTIRDNASLETKKIYIDSEEKYGKAYKFVRKLVPHLQEKIELYTGRRPLFDLYSIESEIERILKRKVPLKSGGYIIVDQTEAMTTIDVNTGTFIGYRNLEETIFKTNMEAASCIVRQLRLRNLGGIIIVDFIDMKGAEHQRQVLRSLEKGLEGDYVKTQVHGVSKLGLVEITRKRTRDSLENVLCEPCSTCNGRGKIKTVETICYEIFREIIRESQTYENDTYMVLAAEIVLDRLLEEESSNIAELESLTKKTIRFQVEPKYSQEQFDVVLV